jgi:hypothetical protein
MSDESSVPGEVLLSAKSRLDEEEITLADNEEIIGALSELTPVYENERSYFVLGNYDREQIRRLNLVVDRLNRRTDADTFRMVDVRGEWDNSIQKFCLIADIVSTLVGVTRTLWFWLADESHRLSSVSRRRSLVTSLSNRDSSSAPPSTSRRATS